MKRDWNLFPSSSGNVTALSFRPRRRVLLPNTTKAIKIPTRMFIKASQRRPMPRAPAAPPKPIIAEVLMKVAPYEIARM